MAETKVTWRDEDIAEEPLLDPLLDDMGLIGVARENTKKYLVRLIEEDKELCGIPEITMGECNLRAFDFFEGFHVGKGTKPVY